MTVAVLGCASCSRRWRLSLPSLVLLLAPVAPLPGVAIAWSRRHDPAWELIAGTPRPAWRCCCGVRPWCWRSSCRRWRGGYPYGSPLALMLVPCLAFTAATIALGARSACAARHRCGRGVGGAVVLPGVATAGCPWCCRPIASRGGRCRRGTGRLRGYSRRRLPATVEPELNPATGHRPTGPSALGPGTRPGRKSSMIRVFLLDDHEVVRRGLADLLHAAGDIEVVGESGSGAGGDPADPGAAPGRGGAGRAAAGRQRHRRVPGRPGGRLVDQGTDPDLVRGRRGPVRRDHGRGLGIRAQADPRHRPGRRRAPGGRRAVAARPGGDPAGAGAHPARRGAAAGAGVADRPGAPDPGATSRRA